MSEAPFYYPNNQPKRGRNGIAAVALAASLFGGATGAAVEHSLSTKPEAMAQEVGKIIREQQAEKDFAFSTAQAYTESINRQDPGLYQSMSVLGGDIVVGGKDPKIPAITYKNPIALFSMENPDLKTDAKGNFLENKWFGIQSVNTNGQLAILPVQYDQESMSFKANDPDKVMLNVSVAAKWPIKGGPSSVQLFAYDNIGAQHYAHNPDSSAIVPGYTQGMK